MTMLKRLLGIDSEEDARDHAFHRAQIKEALARQSEASEKAESTLVDMLSRAAAQKHTTRQELSAAMTKKG